MARCYWLLKTEPETYSWDDMVAEGTCTWDGVRNYQARNNLREMKRGDLAFIYHSVGPRDVVGVAKVVREAYPDPTTDDDRWSAVDLKAVKPIAKPVTLAAIKAEEQLQQLLFVRNSRISVSPVQEFEFERILEMGGTRLPART
jgi:predicted RNA-binding protein with PUA-like domain